MLKYIGEDQSIIDELLDIKKCGISIEKFEKLLKINSYVQIDKCLWLINPHYNEKFNLMPTKLPTLFSKIKYLRNYLTTSCYCITQLSE